MNFKNFLAIVFTLMTLFAAASAAAADNELASGSLNGSFSSWGKTSLEGDWKIIQEGNKTFIELADNFRAKEGPDVKVFLSPLAASDVTGKNATNGSTFVKLITVFEESNRIEIPQGIDLSQFKSLIFHCEEYSKLWGTSPL